MRQSLLGAADNTLLLALLQSITSNRLLNLTQQEIT